jgi:hypothetical protein
VRRYTKAMNILARLRICLLLFTLLWGCAGHRPGTPSLPAGMDLRRPNQGELAAFPAAYAPGSEEARAAAFLLDNLPPADRLSMTAADLRENLDFAFLARQAMPWGRQVPWDLFLHYVLPHRTSQEPFQPHRAMLFRELAPLCLTARSMEEALSRVGYWCAAKAEYRPTSRRDLGVRSVLDGGWGRCEETNILFMAAARAVGLPVRQAMVPWWQHGDGNHAWVEAWTENGWRFLESGTEFTELNQTWYAAQAPRMPKVAAHVYGHPADPRAYRSGEGFALVDATPAYAPTTQVTAIVVGADNRPVADLDVWFSVYSLGGPRPATRATTDARGEARVTLGPGTFLVSCAAREGLNWVLLDTRGRQRAEVLLRASAPLPLPATLRLAYPGPGSDSFTPVVSAELTRIRTERAERWKPLLAQLPPDLRERLLPAGESVPQWLRLLRRPTDRLSPWIRDLVLNLDDKDLLQADPRTLPEDVDLALQARQASAQAGLGYSDAMFRDFVLSPRLYLEPWSAWRTELRPWFGHLASQPLAARLTAIRDRVAAMQALPLFLFGPSLTPGQALISNWSVTAGDRIVLAAAALRTMGVPARCQPDFGGVDYFDGQDWRFWMIEKRPAASAALHLRTGKDQEPLRDFGLARVQDGYFRVLDDLPWEKTDQGWSCAVQPGEYVLFSALRGADSVTVRCTPCSLADGARVELQSP